MCGRLGIDHLRVRSPRLDRSVAPARLVAHSILVPCWFVALYARFRSRALLVRLVRSASWYSMARVRTVCVFFDWIFVKSQVWRVRTQEKKKKSVATWTARQVLDFSSRAQLLRTVRTEDASWTARVSALAWRFWWREAILRELRRLVTLE